MIKYIDINFKNSKHKDIIYKLSKRNNFYLNDIKNWLYSNGEKSSFENWNNYYENYNKKIILIFPYWKGYLLCIDNKVIGYIIYYERHYKNDIGNFVSIEFLLIDKDYQNKRYGTDVINLLNEKYNDKNYMVVCIEKTNNNANNFYKKLNFIEKYNDKTEEHYKEFSSYLKSDDYNWLYKINNET